MKKDDEHIRWKDIEIIDVNIDSFQNIRYTNSEYEKEFIMFMKILRCSSRKEIKKIIRNNQFVKEVFMLHEKLCLEEPVLNYFTPEIMLQMERKEADRREKEGIIEGAKNKTLELAKKMLKKGIDTSSISEITGLSIENISKL